MQAKTPKYIRYLCVESEQELHKWVTAIRIAKNGRHLYTNYRSVVEEIAHADIDILTSKRFSGAESGGNQNIVSHHLRPKPSVCIISPSVRRLRRCRRGHGCVVIIACEGQLIVDHRQTKPVEATHTHIYIHTKLLVCHMRENESE